MIDLYFKPFCPITKTFTAYKDAKVVVRNRTYVVRVEKRYLNGSTAVDTTISSEMWGIWGLGDSRIVAIYRDDNDNARLLVLPFKKSTAVNIIDYADVLRTPVTQTELVALFEMM